MENNEEKKVKISLKRNFEKLNETSSPLRRFTRKKISKSKSSNISDYFSMVPEHVFITILDFLPKSALRKLKFINKTFYQIASQRFTIIDFQNKSEIPLIFLQSIIKKCLKIEEIRFGSLKKLSSYEFLQNIIDVLDIKKLKVLDFSLYSELNDEILLKCFEKIDINCLLELSLPYSCNITNSSLLFVKDNIKNLEIFQLDSKYSLVPNTNLKQETIANVINNNNSLVSIKLETINFEFLKCLSLNNFKAENLIILKIRNLDLKDVKEIENISILKNCVNLTTFVLMEIFVTNEIIQQDHPNILDEMEKLLKELKNLTTLKLGHFTTPVLLNIIAENMTKLEYFKVVSEHLEIEDIKNFFMNCFSLLKLTGKIGREYDFVTFQKRRIILFF